MLAREVGKREGANAVPATGCRFENMRRPDFLDWRAGHAAAQPKKTGDAPTSLHPLDNVRWRVNRTFELVTFIVPLRLSL